MKTFVVLGNGGIADRMAAYVRRIGHLVEHFRESDFRGFLFYDFDVLLSINNTIVLDEADLRVPKLALNMHPAPLPEYAGLYCHYWALANGEKEFGATIHTMEPKIDSGMIVAQERFPIEENEMPNTLFLKAMNTGFRLMCSVVNDLVYDRPLIGTGQDLSKRKVYTYKMALEAGYV